jgi:hypothetical protein
MDDAAGSFFIAPDALQSGFFRSWFNSQIVNLVEVNLGPCFGICLFTKGRVDKA